MSKPCEGITLAPVKGSHLVTTQQQKPVAQKGAYVPPNKRAPGAAEPEGPKVLTKEELSSAENFPSLGGGASWTQIRDRLAPSKPNFKGMIEERIKRDKQESENREEDEDGWTTLRLGADYGFGPRTSKPVAIDPADFPPDNTEWPPMGIPPGFGEKIWNFVECVNADGTPIERTKLPEKTYHDYEMRERTAREKLLSFVKGK